MYNLQRIQNKIAVGHKVLIDSNVELSKRYKTFDGKFWDTLKEINENTLFILVNISTSSCMLRIENIMEKFNMPENSVEIKLR